MNEYNDKGEKHGSWESNHINGNLWYKENYINEIWNWCEIEEKYIEKVSEEYNLVHYNKEIFDKVVWVCKQKMS